MKIVHTTRCGEFGHPEFQFRVEVPGVIELDTDWLRSLLEGLVRGGERFKDGETLQVGWSRALLRANPDGTLSLLEPDFTSMPIVHVDSMTSSLQHLRLQKDIWESFAAKGWALDIPSFLLPCIVCSRLEEADAILMDRQDPTASDSGWFIGCRHEDHDHSAASELQRMSLYEAVLRNGRALPFLGLPGGTLLTASNESMPMVFWRGEQLAPLKGSYLDALSRRGTG